MQDDSQVEKKTQPSRPLGGGARAPRSRRAHPFELRLKAVKLYLQEGFPQQLIARELGVALSTLSTWVCQYRAHGEEGLRPAVRSAAPPKLPPALKTQMVELKRAHPQFGVKRIAQLLRRMLFLPGSHETVRRTLHEQQLIESRRRKPKRNPPKPRFFVGVNS